MSTEDANSGNRFLRRAKHVEDPLLKTFKIKTNTLKRNLKDLEFVKKEVIRETSRLESIKKDNPDRIKQQENVISEAQMMIPYSENRVRAAVKDLKDFLNEADLSSIDDELIQSAHQVLEEGNCVISQV